MVISVRSEKCPSYLKNLFLCLGCSNRIENSSQIYNSVFPGLPRDLSRVGVDRAEVSLTSKSVSQSLSIFGLGRLSV